MKNLNLGCGRDYREGWINVDIDKTFKPDIIFDLNKKNWCFAEDDEFDYVFCRSVLEHIDKPIFFIKEVIRILKDGCIFNLIVPLSSHYRFNDPTHQHYFNRYTVDYFLRGNRYNYLDDKGFNLVGIKFFRSGFPFYHIYKEYNIGTPSFIADFVRWSLLNVK